MYTRCIFCTHPLGRNETPETFPVGEVIAFDARRGRLWAVCPRCGRWNLAPIEERWEAVEGAESRFRDTRLRLHAENIGVAQLPEGTRLIRVGEALTGEIAAWRYGNELRRRRRSFQAQRIVAVAVGAVLPEALFLRVRARRKEIVHRVRGADLAREEDLLVRERDLRGARISAGGGGAIRVSLPAPLTAGSRLLGWMGGRSTPDDIELTGDPARSLLARALVRVNAAGASDRDVRRALEAVERHGGVDTLLERELQGTLALSERRLSLGRRLEGRRLMEGNSAPAPRGAMLAVEMLLHEEVERQALQGELVTLRARWREAEEIAAIADALLDPAPEEPAR
jgi:hypothetical protein